MKTTIRICNSSRLLFYTKTSYRLKKREREMLGDKVIALIGSAN